MNVGLNLVIPYSGPKLILLVKHVLRSPACLNPSNLIDKHNRISTSGTDVNHNTVK